MNKCDNAIIVYYSKIKIQLLCSANIVLSELLYEIRDSNIYALSHSIIIGKLNWNNEEFSCLNTNSRTIKDIL